MTSYYIGDTLLIQNKITNKQFEILSVDHGLIQLLDVVLGVVSTEKVNAISELILSGTAKIIPRNLEARKLAEPLSADFATYSEEIKVEARRRFNYVSEVIKNETATYTPQMLLPIIDSVSRIILDEKPPSPRTLCRWLKSFNENGQNIKALIPDHRAKGNASAKIDPQLEPYIDRAISAYKQLERPSISAIHRELATWIHYDNSQTNRKKLKVPSVVTLTKRIEESAPYDLYASRNGKRLARVNFKYNQFAPQTSFILQRVEIDHTLLDIFVVDAENRILLGRPWITALIDKHSRCIFGSHIGFESPSYLSVAKALKVAILPKDNILNRYPSIQNKWPCFGVPSILVTDRGKEFESQAFEDACCELNISIQRSPAKHPWYKGAIESYFKTVNQSLITGMPGSVLPKKLQGVTEYDPAKNGILSLDAFLEIFYIWIVDIYHQSPAANNSLIPINTWMESVDSVPITPIAPEKLNLILSENKEVALNKSGIKINYIAYDSEELLSYRMRYKTSKIVVKYDRENLGAISVYNKYEDKFFIVPAVDKNYAEGLTLYQHIIMKRYVKKYISDSVNPEGLATAKMQIINIIENEILTKKQSVKASKQISRFMGVGQQSPLGDGNTSLVAAVKQQSVSIPYPEQNVKSHESPLNTQQKFTDGDKSTEGEFITHFPDELNL